MTVLQDSLPHPLLLQDWEIDLDEEWEEDLSVIQFTFIHRTCWIKVRPATCPLSSGVSNLWPLYVTVLVSAVGKSPTETHQAL